MIKLNNVNKVYNGLHAVNGITLEIPSNVIYGIIGKSGAGKSTLVRLMSLLEQPDSGTIYFDKDRVDALTGKALLQRRWKLGMIFQNFNLFTSRNVFGNVAYPLEIVKMPKELIEPKVINLLKLVGLEDKIYSPISQLSGGQKQRVAIARALANDPEILFCDEATSALDPQTTTSILELIKEIKSKINLTVVMITHQMEVVRETCDFVAVVSDGMVVESGTVKDIFSQPKTDVAREFLSALKPIEDLEILSSGPFLDKRYRLHFLGDSTHKPVISHLVREFQVDVNILSGTIRTVDKTPMGELVVELSGSNDRIEAACKWLYDHNVKVESLND